MISAVTPATIVDSSKDRVRRHREAMRAKGYRTVTLWLPDSRRSGFAEECRKQSQIIKKSAAEKKYLDELDLPAVEGWS
jgi:ribosomal protein L3